jgi:DNA-binding HxlR family transcriptional regulator
MRLERSRVSQVALAIQQVVKANPGIHFRGLGRATRVTSAGQLRHHLDRLGWQGIVVEIADGRYKRYFIAGDHDARIRPTIARFSRDIPCRIAKLLLTAPMNRSQLRRRLGCSDSTLGYHLNRMVGLGDLARVRKPNCCLYVLANAETIRPIVLAQDSAGRSFSRSTQCPGVDDEIPNALRPNVSLQGNEPAAGSRPSHDFGDGLVQAGEGLPDPTREHVGTDPPGNAVDDVVRGLLGRVLGEASLELLGQESPERP